MCLFFEQTKLYKPNACASSVAVERRVTRVKYWNVCGLNQITNRTFWEEKGSLKGEAEFSCIFITSGTFASTVHVVLPFFSNHVTRICDFAELVFLKAARKHYARDYGCPFGFNSAVIHRLLLLRDNVSVALVTCWCHRAAPGRGVHVGSVHANCLRSV